MFKQARHLLNLLRFAKGEQEPIIGPVKAMWEVLYICNAMCRTCDRWREQPDPRTLSTAEGKSLIAQLAQAGVLHLCFTGGEPLLRKDIFELIACAHENKLSTSMFTNALLLNERRANELINAGLDAVYISLDGSTPELNDTLRGINGYLQLASAAIESLKALRSNSRPKIFIAFTVNKANMYDLENLARFVKSRALDGLSFQPALHVPDIMYRVEDDLAFAPGDGAVLQNIVNRVMKMYGDILPMSRDYYRHFATHIDNPREPKEHNNIAGYALAMIDPFGHVYPDPLKNQSMGNVREQTFEEIWFGHRAREVRHRIAHHEHPVELFESFISLNLAVRRLNPLNLHRTLRPLIKAAEHF
jgi:MoaA/NifB/PqqE/SkfB family radical SAM enzyme